MNKLLRILLIGIASNFLLVSFASAANFYVRNGASGANNGSDWTNAWSQMDSINYSLINPGDTIYIAAGTYGALNISKGGTAGNPITFKRATGVEHGTATGWSSGYDGKVIIDGGANLCAVCMSSDYITIDGATRYGIWVKNAMYGVRPQSNNLTLRFLELGDAGVGKLGEDGIQGSGNNLVVESCYIHDNDNATTHGDGIQWFQGNNIIFRYNVFKNNGQVFILGETNWNVFVNDLQFYYNLVYNRGGAHYNGLVSKGSPTAGHFFHIYNNTIDLEAIDNSGYNNVFNLTDNPAGTVEFKNNAVIYSNTNSVGGTHNNNGYDNSGTLSDYNIPTETGGVSVADLGFVNVTTGTSNPADYHLLSSSPLIGKGVSIGLAQDFDGKSLPSTPSIGAFESGTGSNMLSAPTALTAVP